MADRSISRASRLVVSALTLGMIGLDAGPALADVIALRGGGRVRGKVIPNVKEGSDRVTILPEKGRTPLVFQKEQVVGVTAEPGPLDEYLTRRDRATSTADSQFELGLWCEGHTLQDLARLHFEAAVGYDKAFAPAHRKLGHVLHEDRWLTADERREAQGLVRYKGRWISRNEKDEREARAASVAEQASWARRIRLLRQAVVAGPSDRVDEARQQLTDIREPAAIAPLVRILGEEGAPLRTLLDRILGEIPDDEAAAALVGRILREVDPEVRPVTMEELQRRTEPVVVTGLVRALGSDRPEVVNRAAWALANMGAVAAVPKLIPALVTVRYRVVWMPTESSRSNGLGPSFGSVRAAPGVGGPVASNGRSIAVQTGPVVAPGAVAFGATSIPYPGYGSTGVGIGGGGSGPRGPIPMRVPFTYQNSEVLSALVKLTGHDFGYDRAAWRSWLNTAFRPDSEPVRRVPQP